MINNSAPQAHGTLRPFFPPPFSVFFGLIEPIAAHDGVTGAYETVRRTVLPSVPHAAFFPFFFFFFLRFSKFGPPGRGDQKPTRKPCANHEKWMVGVSTPPVQLVIVPKVTLFTRGLCISSQLCFILVFVLAFLSWCRITVSKIVFCLLQTF